MSTKDLVSDLVTTFPAVGFCPGSNSVEFLKRGRVKIIWGIILHRRHVKLRLLELWPTQAIFK